MKSNQLSDKFYQLPKAAAFAVLGAIGALVGWLLGELVLIPTYSQKDETSAPRVLVFSNEMQSRLDREGAEQGEIELALRWDNKNDIDLHCKDPRGEIIFFGNKRSRSKGWLDVDMNVIPSLAVNNPVEHIRWLDGDAPEGKYEVYVHHYKNHILDNEKTPFALEMKIGDKLQQAKGSAVFGDTPKLVHEFNFNRDPAAVIRANQIRSERNSRQLFMTLIVGLWTGVLALGISFALVAGQNFLLRRQLLTKREALFSLIGAIVAGFISGSLSQLIFALVAEIDSLVYVGQVAGWMMLGGLLAMGISSFIPNLNLGYSSIGGILGGLVGSIVFLIATMTPFGDIFGRLVGSATLGAGIGVMIAFVEQITRSAYIKVYWGPKQQSQVTLGPQPVLIGSSPQAHITIPSKSVAGIAGAVVLLDKKIELEDRNTKSKRVLNVGDRIEYAHVTLEICSGGRESAGPVMQKDSSSAAQHLEEVGESKPKASVQQAKITLTGEGRLMSLRMRTKMNKHNLKQFGPDSQFADSDYQYELLPEGESWCIVPNGRAKNETLLNGRCLNDKTAISNGDKISIGRQAKGVSKLELQVQI